MYFSVLLNLLYKKGRISSYFITLYICYISSLLHLTWYCTIMGRRYYYFDTCIVDSGAPANVPKPGGIFYAIAEHTAHN